MPRGSSDNGVPSVKLSSDSFSGLTDEGIIKANARLLKLCTLSKDLLGAYRCRAVLLYLIYASDQSLRGEQKRSTNIGYCSVARSID